MLRKLVLALMLLLASSFRPVTADYSNLQAVTAGVDAAQITVEVQNPSASTEAARIQVSVKVQGGTTETLTIPTVTVEPSGLAVVTASASAPIVQIIDDPQPIGP